MQAENQTLPARWRVILAAAWAIFVVGMYAASQLARHWPAIREQIIAPLLGSGS